MALEIERKFLIGPVDAGFLASGDKSAITQVYISAASHGSERVRSRSRFDEAGQWVTQFTRTAKRTVRPGVDEEVEHVVSAGVFARLAAVPASGTFPVVKSRWTVPFDGLVLEIDQLTAPVALWLLEVELPDESFLTSRLVLPDEVSVLREVTGDPAFKNAALASGALEF